MDDDHAFERYPTILKLLGDSETFIPAEVTVPEGLTVPTYGGRCKRCIRIYDYSAPRFTDAKEFVWHVRAK